MCYVISYTTVIAYIKDKRVWKCQASIVRIKHLIHRVKGIFQQFPMIFMTLIYMHTFVYAQYPLHRNIFPNRNCQMQIRVRKCLQYTVACLLFVCLECHLFLMNRFHFELQILTFARHSWPLSIEGSSTWHTYCDTGQPFMMVISEDPWHTNMLPSV